MLFPAFSSVLFQKKKTKGKLRGGKDLACENIRFSSLVAAGDVSRNVPNGEERGETDVFAG